MRRAARFLAILSVAASFGGCRERPAPTPHPRGADSFTSPAPGAGAPPTRADLPPTPGPTTAGGGAGAPRTVEEADVYKLSGSTLYVLNAYRGLQILDLSDLSAPRLLSRVALSGRPVDLYLRGTTAFVLVSDFFRYQPVADSLLPRRGSRLLAVDVADPKAPAVVADLAIEGEVEQTRLVGDVLYVFSRHYWWYEWVGPIAPGGGPVALAGGPADQPQDTVFVASFDVTVPSRPVAVERLELPSAGWDVHAQVTAERLTLSFAGWDAGASAPSTHFQPVDISDPGGALRAGKPFSSRGQVRDRWSMDFDAATSLFRAVLASGWNAGASLEIWSSPDASAATSLSRLDIKVAESLTAARFDGSRVYLVTALRIDPLWVVDASDPAHPVLGDNPVHMPGQLDFIEPRGDRLVALGHTNEAGQPFQLAVSLFDVARPSSPALLSRVVFGSSWSWVPVRTDDLRKAFLVFDPPPAGIGLVMVPLQGWDAQSYRSVGGTQLVDLGRDTLALRGFLAHPGNVHRAFPADASGARLVALSDQALQTIDASDRGAPKELARLDLARPVTALALVSGKVVELSGDWWRGEAELDVTELLDPDAPTPLARLALKTPFARLFTDGPIAWLLAWDSTSAAGWLQAVDLSDPLHPAPRGRLDLPPEEAPYPWWGGWGLGDEAAMVGHALAVRRSTWIATPACPPCGRNREAVRVYDLSDPDRPVLSATVEIPDAGWSWGLVPSGSFVWLSHYEWAPDGGPMGRFFVDRIDLADPARPVLLPKVNVPGQLIGASPDGARLFALEAWWQSSDVKTCLHGLELGGDGKARLYGSACLPGYTAGAVLGDGHAYAVTADGASLSSSLFAVELGSVAVTSESRVQGSWAWPRKVAGGKLFLQASWRDEGLLVYGLASPGQPAFEQLARTQGWAWDVVVGGGWAYLPSGPYGVPMVKLAP